MITHKKSLSVIAVLILLSCFWLYKKEGTNKTQNISSIKEVPSINGLDTSKRMVSSINNNKYLRKNLVSVSDIKRKLAIEREKYAAFMYNHPFNKNNHPEIKNDDDNDGEQEENEPDHPELAWQQDFLRTMDPKLKRPTPEVLPAIIRKNQTLLNSRLTTFGIPGTASAPWVERGPNNVGGRTRALVWDPNDIAGKKVWAGGVTGGLWYNNDITSASSSWNRVNDFWADLAVSCIAFDPNNPLIVYAGTGEGFAVLSSNPSSLGAGIWKSIDGGNTWSQITSTANFSYVNDIVVRNENGTSKIYAAVDGWYYNGVWHNSANAGLQSSSNGGSTWTQVLPLIPSTVINFVPASISIGKDNRIWIGTKSSPWGATDRGGGRVLYSDDGTTWITSDIVNVTNGYGRVTVACAPSDANYVYSFTENNNTVSAIRKTSNAGTSWVNVYTPVDADNGIPSFDFSRGQAWYDQALKVDPNDPNVVMIGAIDLFRTTNGGTTWNQISKWSNNLSMSTLTCSIVHADQHAIVFKPGSSSTAIFGNDGGVFYTTSVSTASTNDVIAVRNNNYNVTQFYAAAINPNIGSNNYLAGAQDNGTQTFSTPGINATTFATSGDGAYCFIDQLNPSYQIASYVYNQYYLSTNGGASFSNLLSDANTGSFINPACYDNNQHILYTYKSTNSIYRVSNITSSPITTIVSISGLTTNSSITAFKVSPYTTLSTTLFIGSSSGNLLKVANANATPTITNITGTLPVGSISCIEIGSSENELLVTFFNYGVKKIWYTSDGGSTWVDKSGDFPNIPARWALFNPNNRTNEVILATELGIYGSTNFSAASPNWAPSNTGFANVRTDMLQMRNSDYQVIAATHGRGLFSSNGFVASGTLAPTITSFSPTSAGIGETVTITGTNLTGTTGVSFGGTAATSYNVISSTSVTAVVGSGTSGTVNVTTPGGTAIKTGYTYTYYSPTITSFTPLNGIVGTTVTITGTNFNTTPANNIVFFGATKATVTAASATSLTVTVPIGATYAPITVLNASTTLATYSNKNFIPTFSPNKGSITANDFAACVQYNLSSKSYRAIIGDLDGDGKPDIVALNYKSNSVSVLQNISNNGTIKFAAGVIFSTGQGPLDVAMGDINGDGKLDLAVLNWDGTITVLLNTTINGNISFTSQTTSVVGTSVYSIALSDLDGDGKIDIVISDALNQGVFVLLNTTSNGILNFANKVLFVTGGSAYGLAIADLDGDGKPDITVANNNVNTVSVLRNTSSIGNISFANKIDFATGSYPYGVAIGDLDGDGKADLVITNQSSKTVSVLRNTGMGVTGAISFATKVDFGTGADPVNIAIGDLDGDGKPDLAVANSSGFSSADNTVSILHNESNSSNIVFSTKVDFSTIDEPQSVAIGDLDGDGKPDFVSANYSSSTISVFKNTPNIQLIPTIITSGNLSAFATCQNIHSSYQSFTISGSNLTDNIIVSVPTGYEISDSSNSGYSNSITLTQINGTVSSATLYVRLTNTATGTPSGNITCTSTGAATQNIAVTGTVNAIPATPTISNSRPLIFCTGDSTVLTSSAISGNQWYKDGTAISGAITTTYSATAAGSYTVSTTNSNGCTSAISTATIITVNALPATPTITSKNATTFCLGGADTLVSSAGSGNQWYLNGATISAATGTSYVANANGNYTVTTTNSNGCISAASSVAVITVNALPTPTISNNRPLTFCSGDSTVLTSSINTGNQWLLNGTAITSATTATLIVKTSGNYTITNTNSNGCSATSSVITVTVNTIPAIPTITSKNATSFCQGGADTLVSSASSGNQWYKDGTAISSATNTTYPATTAGSYTVSTTNSNGCTSAISTAAVITVNALPSTPTITSKNATTFCQGSSDTLTSSTGSGNQWLLNGAAINNATGVTYTATASGNYTVQTTNSNGCTSAASTAITITVNAIPAKPTITRDVNNNLVSSSATGNQWFNSLGVIGSATNQTYKPSTDGSYFVQVTQNGCTSPNSDAYYYLVTAVINLNTNETVTIYPNPATDILRIDYKLININTVTAQLYDINGVKLLEKTVNSGSSISLSNYANGHYTLQLVDNKTHKLLYSCHVIKSK